MPTSLGQFFDSTKSPTNPYNYPDYQFFVYGTLPLFLVKVVAQVVNSLNQTAHIWSLSGSIAPIDLTDYSGVHFVGRALSALFDLGSVWLIYMVGRRLYGQRVGLLAAALLAFSALPLQQSHFFTVNTFGSFFCVATIYFAVRIAYGADRGSGGRASATGVPGNPEGGWLCYIGMGAGLGAALATRINLLPMLLIGLLAAGIRAWHEWGVAQARARTWPAPKGDGAATWHGRG